ncbi:MAG: hypothetical protein JWL64_2345 [Frankiales bacterium]|nr:hypothetical protein [Frankiales bacterium]
MTDRRVASLDGLRGIAALVVVLHHCLLMTPGLADAYRGIPGYADWFTYTPLHLVWAGGEAVTVFFVLSGFVLTLPFLGPAAPSLRSYLGQRIIRLYVPVWAALAFAVLLVYAFARTGEPGQSWWMRWHAGFPGLRSVARSGFLLRGTDTTNSALWSLQWEVVFSLVLPAIVFVAVLTRRLWMLTVPALLVLVVVGVRSGSPALTYLPVFGFGVVAAVHREPLTGLVGRLRRSAHLLCLVVALLLLLARWQLVVDRPAALAALSALGAAGLVVLVMAPGPSAEGAGVRPALWLGRLSFSLYLVHEPVVVSVGAATGWTDPFALVALGLPLSLGAAMLFFRVVEAPSHRLARRVAQRTAPRRHAGAADGAPTAPLPALAPAP